MVSQVKQYYGRTCTGRLGNSLAVARMAQTDKFDAIIGLGAVIRGSTPQNFDFVAGESAKGLGAIGLDYDVPRSLMRF